MDLFRWFDRKKKSAKDLTAELPPAVRFIKPPVVMTIAEWDRINDETPTQFLQYGWRRGEENEFTRPWDQQLKFAYQHGQQYKIHSMSVMLPNGLGLRAASFISPQIENMGLNTMLILYLSAEVAFKEMPKIDPVTGGATPELSDTLRYIALRMESRIMTVITDSLSGQVLVVLRSWAKNYTIYNNEERWTVSAQTDTTIKKESDKP